MAYRETGRFPMNRRDLQALSRMRANDATLLLQSGRFQSSYYLMGYAVECGIKAVIARRTRQHDFPDKKLAQDSYSHELKSLLQTANLWSKLDADMGASQALANNWAVAKDWSVTSRYSLVVTQKQAQDFHSACTARKHGILSWLKKYW